MSGALAIAGVSAALKAMLTQGLAAHRSGDVLGTVVTVSVGPPRADGISGAASTPELTLFLYRVAENGALRNIEPRSGGSDPRANHNPPIALDLHYLLTTSATSELQSEVLLGSALLTLRSSPVLRSATVQTVLFDTFGSLGVATLNDPLTISLQTLSTAELAPLWSALQAPLRPSVTFQVSVLILESESGEAIPLIG